MNNESIDWHQTRPFSITVILLLLTNIITTVWWAATLTSDVTSLKDKPDLTERVIRLEAITEAHAEYLNKLDITLDSLNETIYKIDKEQVKLKADHKNSHGG